jgi:HPt (histidine-containing phosphotransfer) domain-containing protein
MTQQPALDPAAIERLHRLGGTKLVRGMIESFMTYAPTRMQAAHDALAANDLEQIRQAAHALKSSAGNLGASMLQETCRTLEVAAADMQQDRIQSLVDDMDAQLENVQHALAELRAHYNS